MLRSRRHRHVAVPEVDVDYVEFDDTIVADFPHSLGAKRESRSGSSRLLQIIYQEIQRFSRMDCQLVILSGWHGMGRYKVVPGDSVWEVK